MKMKKALVILFFISLVGIVEKHYTMPVTVVSTETETVFVEDSVGHIYSFYGNGFETGDKLNALFDTNTTDFDRSDDRIVKVWERK